MVMNYIHIVRNTDSFGIRNVAVNQVKLMFLNQVLTPITELFLQFT